MRRAARIDNTATALIQYAKSIGFDYGVINGDIDGYLWLGRRVVLVDWKSPKGELTPTQARMVAKGAPIHFVSKPEQLDALKSDLMRVA
jgi:ATP-dependent exoDNAse (exonuclease V) beta subunit